MPSTRRYATHVADAKGVKCDTCGEQAAKAIRVETTNFGSKKGSRTVGIYCQKHCDEKLTELRANAEKEAQRRKE